MAVNHFLVLPAKTAHVV